MNTDKTSIGNESQPSCLGAVSGSFLFDRALLEKATIKQPEYVMGVDTYDKDALAYCFGRKVDGVFEIMLSKTMRDKNATFNLLQRGQTLMEANVDH